MGRARALQVWIPALFLLAPLAADCRAQAGGRGAVPAAAARIDRVLAGLRPRVAVKGATPIRWTLAGEMAAHHVPGVSIAVIDSGRIVWATGFGVKEAGTADSVAPETLFQAASISKPVAATGMLRLVERGKLSLDENVNTYLKSWQVPDNKFTATEKVTLRRIVSHNAGLTIHGFPGYPMGDPIPTTEQVLNGQKPANTAPVRVDTFPGAISNYSGGGVTIEQLVLQEVTGKPFPVFMKEMVLDPAGMTRSTYEQPLPEARRAEAASAHNEKGEAIKGKWHVYPEMAAAGLWTTPTDLAKWALEIAAARDGRSSKVLSQRMAIQMLTAQRPPFGLGPSLDGSGRGFRFGHGGSNEGFRCQLILFPEVGKGAAVMTNADDGSAVTDEILMALAAEYGWPDYGQKVRATVALDPGALDALAGEYQVPNPNAAGRTPIPVRVSHEGSGLFLEVVPYVPKHEIFPASADSFFTLSAGEVVFTRDRSGRGMKVRLGGQTATRVK
ncbi:MAG TPA: serine hydrolase domain-containing protein [Gemmatimonadales bacterium]|jgi:CubicO group peptidase (beta-lactamase class C family)|nr:serine hydrolase domain-containing protein [Gemmatimonadales bacterium]